MAVPSSRAPEEHTWLVKTCLTPSSLRRGTGGDPNHRRWGKRDTITKTTQSSPEWFCIEMGSAGIHNLIIHKNDNKTKQKQRQQQQLFFLVASTPSGTHRHFLVQRWRWAVDMALKSNYLTNQPTNPHWSCFSALLMCTYACRIPALRSSGRQRDQ